MPTLTEDEVVCGWCTETTHTDDVAGLDGTGTEVCQSCVDDDGFNCNDCGDITSNDDSVSIGWGGHQVCMGCYEADYFYCEGCDESLAHREYGGDGYCNDCYGEDDDDYCDCGECGGDAEYASDRHSGIRRWGDRPDLMFHSVPMIGPHMVFDKVLLADKNSPYSYTPNPGEYYLGMEIELEDTSADIVGPFASRFSDHLWATTDATVSHGYEIVTMPHTFDAWMTQFPWDEWTSEVHNQVPDQSHFGSNGIHIHVSRTAFYNKKGRYLASHLYKFMQFIRRNESAIMLLSERTGNSYCKWSQERDGNDAVRDAKADTSTSNYERYRPVNTQNRETIELRFFDGRSDPAFMKRSLMFVHSLVEFTRNAPAKGNRGWEAYTEYVTAAGIYPELVNYFTGAKARLLASATASDDIYKTRIMPSLKAKKERQRQAMLQQQAETRRMIDARRRLVEDTTRCNCPRCRTAQEGEHIRTYMDGNFTVEVTRTAVGERHAYTHSSDNRHADGEHIFRDGQPRIVHVALAPEYTIASLTEQEASQPIQIETLTLRRELS